MQCNSGSRWKIYYIGMQSNKLNDIWISMKELEWRQK
jgi:hypothetical protein